MRCRKIVYRNNRNTDLLGLVGSSQQEDVGLYAGLDMARDVELIESWGGSQDSILASGLINMGRIMKVIEPVDRMYGFVGLLSPEHQA